MNYASILVSGNVAKVRDRKVLTSGTIGAEVVFTFDESWDGMDKTLVWKGSGVTLDDTACTSVIPQEVLTKAGGRLLVGVYGTAGDTATPTVWADLGVILPGANPSGDESTDPSLPVWAQLQQQIEDIRDVPKNVSAFENDAGYQTATDVEGIVAEAIKDLPNGGGGDGFSPVANVTQTETGAVITITDKSGTTTAAIENGKDGQDGKTPVKGVDYFTQADRQEIADQAAQLVEMPHVPKNVSAFENDAGYQTAADVKAIVDRELGVIENGAY